MRRVNTLEAAARLAASPIGMGILLAALGLSTWTGLSLWRDSTDANPLGDRWASDAYFYAGLPAMALAVAVAAFLRPRRAWRWPLWLVAGHQLGVLLVGLGMQSGLSLLILTMILAVMLAAFFAIPATLAAMAARRSASAPIRERYSSASRRKR